MNKYEYTLNGTIYFIALDPASVGLFEERYGVALRLCDEDDEED